MTPDWLPAAFNDGWTYRDRVTDVGVDLPQRQAAITSWYAARYAHSDRQVWGQRLAAGEIWRNGQQLWGDGPLAAGDRLVWHRPPWQEAAVPVLPGPLFDDGDLVVFNKPSGLPVLPAGGYLRHTVLGQLEAQVQAGELDACSGLPRPVHRLGRFTSGLLVCARTSQTRAWMSAQLRESTAAAESAPFGPTSELASSAVVPAPLKKSATHVALFPRACFKVYRALLTKPQPGSLLATLRRGQTLQVTTPIGLQPHGRLGKVWAASTQPGTLVGLPALLDLPAWSDFKLLAVRPEGWLVEVAIATGRPHQIRIHAAAGGAPLLGDPLYRPGGLARADVLPGDGGYQLHAHRMTLQIAMGGELHLEAPLPRVLEAESVLRPC